MTPTLDLLRRGGALVWDNHACMPLRPDDHAFLGRLADARAAGVDVISLNIGFGPQGAEAHLAMLDSFATWLTEHEEGYSLVRSVGDIRAARAGGKLAVIFDIEGMVPLDGGRIDLIERFRASGVGWMLVAYNRNNDAGGGCTDEDGGLTAYGREVLREMRRVGMIVCCSHTGHRTAREVIDAADMPVIFSHSNASVLHNHYRNIPDDLIRACAASGGVVGINGLSAFLGGEASPELVATHIDHVAQLVGAEHVGLGLDFVYDRTELDEYLLKMRETFPDDPALRDTLTMVPPTCIGEIAEILAQRGYRTEDLHAILGENWLRVASNVWR